MAAMRSGSSSWPRCSTMRGAVRRRRPTTGRRWPCGVAIIRPWQVIDLAPDSGHGYLELVLFLESAGRREEARQVARQAIERHALWADEWQRCPIYVKGG